MAHKNFFNLRLEAFIFYDRAQPDRAPGRLTRMPTPGLNWLNEQMRANSHNFVVL